MNVRNIAYKVTIYKPSTTSSLENYGSNENIGIEIKENEVTLNMPKASYIWLKGKDTEWDPPEDNNKQDWKDEEESSNILLYVLIPSLFILIAGVAIGIFFYFKKCKNSQKSLEDNINDINSKIIDDNK